MNKTRAAEQISTSFHKLVSSDAKIHNAHLLVHSEKDGLHLSLSGGDQTVGADSAVHTGQPVFMASVGKMKHTFLLGHSQPLEENPYPIAGVFFGDTNVVHDRFMSIDYAGGGVTGPLEDMLKFMRALVQGSLLRAETLQYMDDCAKFSIGIDYCYGMMKIRTVPVLMPARYNCWGNAGSTGAFLFYHPGQDAYLIGSLNQFRYHAKGIRFMLRVIDRLIKNNG